jgi:hypothetical protein
MARDGRLVVGEVGDYVPDIQTIPVVDGEQFVIEFSSGMMDFQYAVPRSVAGLHSPMGGQRTPDEVHAHAIASLEKVLRKGVRYGKWPWFWRWWRIEHPSGPVPDGVRDWIETMVTAGELYLLAHELGHVALDTKTVKPLSDNDETEADRYGLKFLLPALENRWHKRMAFAAPVVPIQVFGALQRMGASFSEKYPSPSERLSLLRQQLRGQCPSDQYYYEASTVLVSWQDMFDDLLNKITGTLIEPDGERLMIRLLAQLEEVAKGRVSMARFIEDIGLISDHYPRDAVLDGARRLVDQYVYNLDLENSFTPPHIKVQMTAALVQLIEALPNNLKPLFPELSAIPPAARSA